MRNKLLATVAVAAVVGFGGFAAAQSQMGGESNKAPESNLSACLAIPLTAPRQSLDSEFQ